MAQKTNSKALRLKTQSPLGCWYSNRFYPQQLLLNYQIIDYLQLIWGNLSTQWQPQIYIKCNYQYMQILSLLPTRRPGRRERRSFPFNKMKKAGRVAPSLKSLSCLEALPYGMGSDIPFLYKPLNTYLGKDNQVPLQNKSTLSNPFFQLDGGEVVIGKKDAISFKNSQNLKAWLEILSGKEWGKDGTPVTNLPRMMGQIEKTTHIQRVERKIGSILFFDTTLSNLSNSIKTWNSLFKQETSSKTSQSILHPGTIKLHQISLSYPQQNAEYLAQKMRNGLLSRWSYFRLRRFILTDVKSCDYIKGIRVVCSGRIDVKSRKAQKAQVKTFHWGQTQLNVFSSWVQFSQLSGSTPFGKIGVKVWLNFKKDEN